MNDLRVNDPLAELRLTPMQRLYLQMQRARLSKTAVLGLRARNAQIRKSTPLHRLVYQARRRGDTEAAAVHQHPWTFWMN